MFILRNCKINPAATWVAGVNEILCPKRGQKKHRSGITKWSTGLKRQVFLKFYPSEGKKKTKYLRKSCFC